MLEHQAAGRIVGSFTAPLYVAFVASPLGAIPKKEPESFHVIYDLSVPKGGSANDFISNIFTKVVYKNFGQVIQLVNMGERGALIAKVNIQSAFRILPITPIMCSFVWILFL